MLSFDGLNQQQKEAVFWNDGSLLVLAGAGSGKTRVLASRLAWLIESRLCHPSQILAVTFTNKAAKEMVGRVSALISHSVQEMWIGTFHGLCLRFLKRNYREAGLTSTFQILDAQDQQSLIKRILKEENKDAALYPPAQVINFINHLKQKGLRCSSVPADNYFYQKMLFLYERYERICREEMLVDFSELILRSDELLRAHATLQQKCVDQFRFILVDEFQDTSQLQYSWLKAVSGCASPCCRPIFAVGDDDQSIYSFRGATVDNIRSFQQDFNVQKVIRLEQNYRSASYILDAANHLIAQNASRLGKNLWTDKKKKGPIVVCAAKNDYYEALWIAHQIDWLVRKGLGSLSKIAVLYRTNAQSRCIEHVLFSSNIPFRIIGGARFFDRTEMRHIIAYLRLLLNDKDNTAFLRIVNVPARSIGAQTVVALQKAATEKSCSLFVAAQHYQGAKLKAIHGFCRLIESLRSAFSSCRTLVDYVALVIQETALIQAFPAAEQRERSDNLNQLLLSIESFEKESTPPEGEEASITALLSAFLTSIALETSDSNEEETSESVSLMTVHMSKGLEFDSVFIAGLEQGLFPSERRDSSDFDKNLEEERRLMYVAMTRAKENLFLSFCRERRLYSQTDLVLCERSQFVDEIPDVHLLRYPTHPVLSDDRRSLSVDPAKYVHSSRSGYRVGQMVRHERFGRGCITDIEGSHDDLYVRVQFEQYGTKLLSLKLAKLEALP